MIEQHGFIFNGYCFAVVWLKSCFFILIILSCPESKAVNWLLGYTCIYYCLYYFAFIYIRFLYYKLMHVPWKTNMNTVVYKCYKVKSLPHWFSTSQVPQPRTTSFLYDLQENFNICISTCFHILFFKEMVLFYILHVLQHLAFPPPPTYNWYWVVMKLISDFLFALGSQGALNSFTIARGPVLNYGYPL